MSLLLSLLILVFTTSGERDLSKGVEKLLANGLERVGLEKQVLLCEHFAVLPRGNGKFRKVSALVYLIYKVNINETFQNL
jgi:hypothetical protein